MKRRKLAETIRNSESALSQMDTKRNATKAALDSAITGSKTYEDMLTQLNIKAGEHSEIEARLKKIYDEVVNEGLKDLVKEYLALGQSIDQP